MKHVKKINEMYKTTEEFETNSFGFKVPIRNYVDDVFDHVVQIICDVNGISEKAFKKLDETHNYVEKYFDNNQEVLLEIDKYKGKRYQFAAEDIYDKHFNNKKELD